MSVPIISSPSNYYSRSLILLVGGQSPIHREQWAEFGVVYESYACVGHL